MTTIDTTATNATAIQAQKSIEENALVKAYRNGNLFTKVQTDSGNDKYLSMSRIGKYLSLPFEDLSKPFNFKTGGINDHKYQCFLTDWTDDSIVVRMYARDNYPKFPKTLLVQLKLQGNRFIPYEVDEKLNAVEKPFYGPAAFKGIPARVVQNAANLPLVFMFQEGRIAEKPFAKVVFSYFTSKADKEKVNLDTETSQILGRIAWTILQSEPRSKYYTIKEFFESYLSPNWELIKENQASLTGSKPVLALPAF